MTKCSVSVLDSRQRSTQEEKMPENLSHSPSSKRFLLPSEKSCAGVPNQGFSVDNCVRQSSIPGAGNGRFVLEPVKAGTPFVVKRVVKMAGVTRLANVGNDRVITFESEAELNKFIEMAMAEGDGITRAQLLTELKNFVWGLDEKRCALCYCTWSCNHGEGATETTLFNFQTLDDGTEAIVCEAAEDLAAGTEVLINYRNFVIAPFYAAWCNKNKVVDVRTLVLGIVDGTVDTNSRNVEMKSAEGAHQRSTQEEKMPENLSHSPSSKRFLLPSEKSCAGVPNQGFSVDNCVRQSSIPGAGNGRFVLEPVKAGTPFVVKRVVKMAGVTRLANVGNDRVITFESEAELNKFIEMAMAEGDGITRAQLLTELKNFVWGLDEKRCALCYCTWSCNHGEGATETTLFNFQTLDDGTEAIVCEAAEDLAAGTEVLINYRNFVIAPFYAAWCNKNKVVDVRTLVLGIVDGIADL